MINRIFTTSVALVVGCLLVASTASASSIVGFEATITGIPEMREDGAALTKDEIKAFRVFVVEDSGLEALTPDIMYDNESDVAVGTVYVTSDEVSGVVDVCAMTIDTFDQISTICSDVVSAEFSIQPPEAPGTVTITQSMSISVNISPGT